MNDMFPLYIDFFSHISLTDRVKQTFNGAGNGTKLLLLQIMESEYYGRDEVYLILHKGYKPTDLIEEKIISAEYFKKVYVDNLEEINYAPGSVLFIPLEIFGAINWNVTGVISALTFVNLGCCFTNYYQFYLISHGKAKGLWQK